MSDVIAAVCRIPIDFYADDVSTLALVRGSGYEAARSELTVDHLVDHFSTHPELVDAWLAWSEDNRSSPAWYIEAIGSRDYEVGYYTTGRQLQFRFKDRVRACSEFVAHYLEHVAS